MNCVSLFYFYFAVEVDEIVDTTSDSIGDGVNNNNANLSSSPDNSDDFVLVPNNLPVVDANAYDKKWVMSSNLVEKIN